MSSRIKRESVVVKSVFHPERDVMPIDENDILLRIITQPLGKDWTPDEFRAKYQISRTVKKQKRYYVRYWVQSATLMEVYVYAESPSRAWLSVVASESLNGMIADELIDVVESPEEVVNADT